MGGFVAVGERWRVVGGGLLKNGIFWRRGKAVEKLVESRCVGRGGVDRVVDCMQAAAIAGKTRLPSGQCIQTSI
jgi:hypothetical protein